MGKIVMGCKGAKAWLTVTRSMHWVSGYANVPRFGLRPNLLLYFAAPDTQRTLLVAAGKYFVVGNLLICLRG